MATNEQMLMDGRLWMEGPDRRNRIDETRWMELNWGITMDETRWTSNEIKWMLDETRRTSNGMEQMSNIMR
jgi:hypothetical protein